MLSFYYRGPLFRHFPFFIFSLNYDSVFIIQTHAPHSEPAPTYLAIPQVDVQHTKALLPVVGILYCTKGHRFATSNEGGCGYCGLSRWQILCYFEVLLWMSLTESCLLPRLFATNICASIYDYYCSLSLSLLSCHRLLSLFVSCQFFLFLFSHKWFRISSDPLLCDHCFVLHVPDPFRRNTDGRTQ